MIDKLVLISAGMLILALAVDCVVSILAIIQNSWYSLVKSQKFDRLVYITLGIFVFLALIRSGLRILETLK
jgi:hypothetical protein